MAPHLLLGPLLPSAILEGGGNRVPVRLRSFIIIYHRLVNVPAHNCFNCSSVVPFFSMNFQLVKRGRCRLRQEPAMARNHPTPSDGYQACISNAKAMEGRPSIPAFPARRFLPCAPFPPRAPFSRVEPWLVRTLPFQNPCCTLFPSPRSFARAMLIRSEALPVHRSLALKSGPCAVLPPLLRSEPLPVRCDAFLSLRALARASFSSRRLVSVRQIGVCAMCKGLSYLFRLHESRAGLQHRLLATALERL